MSDAAPLPETIAVREPVGEDDPDAGSSRLTRALHWAQQGTSPEIAQGRWLRRLASQSQQRLDAALSDDQIDDVAMVAALVHAEAAAEGAEMARRRMTRSALVSFTATVVGAALGAGIVQFVVATVLT